MRASSSLTKDQREAAVAWIEQGVADRTVARFLGASREPVRRLYRRWKIHGERAVVTSLKKQSYSFEVKAALVERFLAGETAQDLAAEVQLSSPELLKSWARAYRRDGPEALRPKPKGRPKQVGHQPKAELSELERLQRENERLRAEVAYLGKLRALRAQERR